LVRFLVLRKDGDDGAEETLIGSGITEDVLAAMNAAVQMVSRLTRKEHSLASSHDRQRVPCVWRAPWARTPTNADLCMGYRASDFDH
jgi:hypothetical protein